MPFHWGASLAAFMIALTSSTVVSRAAMNARSTTETLIVGTRIEYPSSLPLSSGRTRPTAAAAPVLVGIIDIVAERARRRSSWKTSVSTWSLVYAWIVVMSRFTTPIFSWSGFTAGARQLVVHEALEITVCEALRVWWFTP